MLTQFPRCLPEPPFKCRLWLKRLRRENPDLADFRLVVAGIVDHKSAEYAARLRALAGDDPAIVFHVRPSDAELRQLYGTCRAVLFTAFNEDWGIVPIEAMHAALNTLSQADCAARFHVSRGLGHGIDGQGLSLGGAFLAECFGRTK